MVRVTFTPTTVAQLERLPRVVRARMLAVVERLEKWPQVSGAKPLRGNLAGHYRIRTGAYRLQFRVEADNLIVEKIGHRAGFYED